MNATTHNYQSLRLTLLFSLCIGVIACSDGTGASFEPIEPAEPVDTSPYELFPLELDFTFELTQQGIDPGELSGLTAQSYSLPCPKNSKGWKT